jgi:hypothetical protein
MWMRSSSTESESISLTLVEEKNPEEEANMEVNQVEEG